MVESLREVAKKDAQLVDDKAKLLDMLTKLTARNEELLLEQQELKKRNDTQQEIQSGLVMALREQNDHLRGLVDEQQDEITHLEYRVAVLEARESGNAFRFVFVLISTEATCSRMLLKIGSPQFTQL